MTGTGVAAVAVAPIPAGLARVRVVTDFDPSKSLAAARDGSQQAWDEIVNEYTSMVWAVARSYRLDAADAADVHQATWLRLVENLGQIRDGERLGAWLCTTARREALLLLRGDRRRRPPPTLTCW